MDESELSALLDQLESLLAEMGLGAPVDQVRRTAADGRAVENETRQSSRRSSRAQASEERGIKLAAISVGDRLAMLIDLVEVAVAGTYLITRDLQSLMQEFQIENVRFSPDRNEGLISDDELIWVLPTGEELEQRRTAVLAILRDLAELRDLTGLSRSEDLGALAYGDHVRDEEIAGWS
ncbi:MAG: hypothetical protein WAV90_12365 [Gordonia amarae]